MKRPETLFQKLGMSTAFLENQRAVAVTLLQRVPTERRVVHGRLVSFFGPAAKRPADIGRCKQLTRTYRYSRETGLGERFESGDWAVFSGMRKGRGFTGVIKRWGFRLQPKSHGSGIVRRKGGSFGTLGMGRLVPGTKMAGRVSPRRAQTHARVLEASRDVIVVQGSVPGFRGALIEASRLSSRSARI